MTDAPTGAATISAADDDWHEPTVDDPAWIETCWFPFWLPEARTTVYVRIWVTPVAGVEGGAVSAWRDDGDAVFTHGWREPFTGFRDLRDLTLGSGLSIRCLEPLQRYAITFHHDDCDVDVEFDAVMAPNSVDPAESPGMFHGHLEQPGIVRGRVRFGGEEHEVDCGTVRDRSWGPRIVQPGLRIGNAHATASAAEAFFAYVNPTPEGVEAVTSGYLVHDGVRAAVVGGERTTTWVDGFPAHVSLVLHDDLGREVQAEGRCVNRHTVVAQADLYAIVNLVGWRIADVSAWGENHDVWSRQAWEEAGRAPLAP